MSKDVFYKQCRLEKKLSETSTSHQMSFIPEPYCVKGKVLKLRDEEGVWENGWVIKAVGQHRVPDSALPDWHSSIKQHRKATGDSMKKEVKEVKEVKK